MVRGFPGGKTDDERSDGELLEAFVKGDVAAFDRIYYRNLDWVRSFHSIRWRREAEELTQETFIRVVRSARTYNPALGEFKGWLFSIAANVQHDYFRRHMWKWAKVALFGDGLGRLREPIQPGPDCEASIRIEDLVKTLALIDREILFLHIEGYTDAEIAETFNGRPPLQFKRLTPKGVATRRRRALEKLGEKGEE